MHGNKGLFWVIVQFYKSNIGSVKFNSSKQYAITYGAQMGTQALLYWKAILIWNDAKYKPMEGGRNNINWYFMSGNLTPLISHTMHAFWSFYLIKKAIVPNKNRGPV